MSVCKAPTGAGTCFALLCSRAGEFTRFITISQVVQKQILKAFTLLHKNWSNYTLRGLPFPGITTAFTEAVSEQTDQSWSLPSASLTPAAHHSMFQQEPNLTAFTWLQLLSASNLFAMNKR